MASDWVVSYRGKKLVMPVTSTTTLPQLQQQLHELTVSKPWGSVVAAAIVAGGCGGDAAAAAAAADDDDDDDDDDDGGGGADDVGNDG